MKKTQKKVLGFFGLALVAGLTTAAIFMPSPEVSATSSVTDTLVVRVVGDTPDIKIISPTGGPDKVKPGQTIKFSHDNIEKATVKLTYTSPDGSTTEVIEDYKVFELDFASGETEFVLDLNQEFGYGTYQLDIKGEGIDGVYDEKSIIINFVPIIPSVEEQGDGSIAGIVDYDKDESGEGVAIEKVEVDVFPHGDNKSILDKPLVITPPATSVTIPFGSIPGLATGDYDVVFTAYDKEGFPMYSYTVTYHYEGTEVPNTGAFFQNLNISKEDYLTTGLILFFVLGVVGISIVAKGRRSNKKR